MATMWLWDGSSWSRPKSTYRTPGNGQWFPNGDWWVDTGPDHPVNDYTNWQLIPGLSSIVPTETPPTPTLANAIRFKVNSSWVGTSNWNLTIIYGVVGGPAGGYDQVFSGLDGSLTSHSSMPFPEEVFANRWGVRCALQYTSTGGAGPLSAWSNTVLLRP